MIKVGILGGAGYTAGELVRVLLGHPMAELVLVQSESSAGKKLYEVHQGIFGDTELSFSESVDLEALDVLFLCSGHGRSEEFWASHQMPSALKVIDLAQDYRDEHGGYVYGLPELQEGRIAAASRIANPGCFATAIQLSLLPLAREGMLCGDVALSAVTGSTGAGVKPSATTHFSWRNDNISTYKVFEHQHLLEINRNLAALQGDSGFQIDFTPFRGDFSRGIFASAAVRVPGLSEAQAYDLYRDYYSGAAFTFVSERGVDLKDVVNTNKALLHLEKHGDKLVASCVIDNLLKGASGQAVQNMNIIFGLPQKTGLNLKASAF